MPCDQKTGLLKNLLLHDMIKLGGTIEHFSTAGTLHMFVWIHIGIISRLCVFEENPPNLAGVRKHIQVPINRGQTDI